MANEHLEKVRAGYYRCGNYRIFKSGVLRWSIYQGEKYIKSFSTLTFAYRWARSAQP